jgi:hypothetical protein
MSALETPGPHYGEAYLSKFYKVQDRIDAVCIASSVLLIATPQALQGLLKLSSVGGLDSPRRNHFTRPKAMK